MPIALIVEYELHEGREQDFAKRLAVHRENVLKEEPGCLRFEVNWPVSRDGKRLPGKIVLNELYKDWDALTVHEQSPRLAGLRADISPMVKNRKPLLVEVL